MTLTVYAFNDGYSLASFLNGILHFFGGSDWAGLVFVVVSLAAAGGVLMATAASDPVAYFRSLAGPVILYAALFSTTCQLNVQDEYSNEVFTVSGVPLGMGYALSTTTSLEKIIVDICEDYLEPVVATKFKEFDFFGQVRAISELLVSDLGRNQALKQTVSQYYDDCVLHGYADGTINQWNFLESADLYSMMETPYSIYFTTVFNPDGTSSVMSCADAYYNVISPKVLAMGLSNASDSPLAQIAGVFGRRAPDLASIRSSLDNLGSVYFTGHQDTSDILFRQNFMMNAIRSNMAANNPQALGALTEAEMKQKTGMASAMSVYLKQLPNLRAMFKLIIMGLFPVVGAFFLIGRAGVLFMWFAALIWTSLFLPMEAIIHACYMTHSISELKGLVDAYGGLTWNNQVNLLTWTSDTATLAGTLMFMIPSLTGMVLGWVAPKAGTAISSMLAGSRAHDRLVMSGGQGALEAAEGRAMGRDQDVMNQTMMEAGDRYSNLMVHTSRTLGAHAAGFVDNAFGQSTWTSGTAGNMLNQHVGQNTLNSGDSASHAKAATDTLSSRESQSVAATANAMKSVAQGHDLSQVSGQVQEVVNSSDRSVQNAFASDKQKVLEEMHSQGLDKNLTASQRNEVATAVTASAWAGVSGSAGLKFLGNGASVEAGTRLQGDAKATSGQGTSDSVAVKSAVSEVLKGSTADSISHRVSQTTGQAMRAADSHSFSERISKSASFNTALGLVKNSAAETSRARQESEAIQSLRSVGNNFQIDVGQQIFGQMDQSTLYALQNEQGFGSLHSAINQGMTLDQMREAAYRDWAMQDNEGRMTSLHEIADLDKGQVGYLAGVGSDILSIRAEYQSGAGAANLGERNAFSGQVQGTVGAADASVKPDSRPSIGPLRETPLSGPINEDLTQKFGHEERALGEKFREQDNSGWRAQVSEHVPQRAGEGAAMSAVRSGQNLLSGAKNALKGMREALD